MSAMIPMWQLLAIADRDPDGGDREPTEADHEAHRRWAIETYGYAAWDRYCEPTWRHVPPS